MSQHVVTDREKRLALLGLLLVFLLGALDSTIVGTAMPRIIQELRGFELYAWVTTSYLLCSTVIVPIFGKLGDLYGRKSVLIFGICIFLLGSTLCGLSGAFGTLPVLGTGMTQLVTFRAIQGLGSAALFSLSFTIVADLFTPRERGKFMGLFGATYGLASAIGPLVGGFFTDHGTVTIAGWEIAGWRWVFYVNLPLGLCSLLLIILELPSLRPDNPSGRIDFVGTFLFIAATVPLLLAITWGGQSYAWTSPQIIGLESAAAVCLGLFVLVERRVRDPLLPLSLFANRVFLISNVAGFLTGMSFLGVIMFMPLFTQVVLGQNATQSGWTQMPMMLGLLVGSIVAGRLATETGLYKPALLGGTFVLLGALAWLAAISTHTVPMNLGLRLFVVGIGLGPSQSLFNLAVQNAVPMTQLGIATSASQFFRQMGSVVGLALFGALLTHTLTAELVKRVPEIAATTARIDLSQVQSQALDPHRMQRELVARADGRYQQLAGRYRDRPSARRDMLADATIPDAVKASLRSGTAGDAPTSEVLAVLKNQLASQATSLGSRLESGMKESFAGSISYLVWLGFWIIVAALLLTFWLPSIPLRNTAPAAERVDEEPAGASRRAAANSQTNYGVALTVLSIVFFMWGFATVLNDVLVPHLKAVFELNYGESLLIQFVFFLAYLLMSMPAATLLERIGYKQSIVAGLIGMSGSALLFVPAAQFGSYGIFLLALFSLASAITLLQVAANPYVTVIGPAKTASSRLNLVQALNSAGTTVAPIFGGILILGRSSGGNAKSGEIALTAAQRMSDAHAVQLPYVLVAGMLLVLALVVWRVRLPELATENRRAARNVRKNLSLWRHRNLVLGIPAIFLYLIAEIGLGSTLVSFISQPNIGAMSHADAARYLSLFWGGAMLGRFMGAYGMRFVRAEAMLAAASLGAFVLTLTAIFGHGHLAMWALIAVGLCHSIMFPTIFSLGVRGLGVLTEEGSGLLIMAIAGGALAALQGVIADRIGLQMSYLLPAACYVYVLFYAVWGSRIRAAKPS